MTNPNLLNHLADLAGIEPDYWDIWGNHHRIEDSAKMRILEALSHPANDDETAQASIRAIEDAPWKTILQPVTVVREGERITVPVILDDDLASRRLNFHLVEEGGTYHEFAFRPSEAPIGDSRLVNGRELRRYLMTVPFPLEIGYHSLRMGGVDDTSSRLIVAPARCYLPAAIEDGGRVWGVSAQVYSLKRGQKTGIGDFTDLKDLVDASAGLGASLVGINPLHTLFMQEPERASPYSPSSRLFLNPIYIDVSKLPGQPAASKPSGMTDCSRPSMTTKATDQTIVDYTAVTAEKMVAFEQAYVAFKQIAKKSNAQTADFQAFCAEWGEPLRLYAIFETLCEQYSPIPWQEWPEAFRRADTPEVQAFAKKNQDRVNFYLFLQWQADRQLAAAQAQAVARGQCIGLYRDLAVGCALDGFDAWGAQEVVISHAKIGCPPDPFSLLGQDWCTPPFDPHMLRKLTYEPFIQLLRANMRHAGALRIDHVMGLMHLFWIPGDGVPKEGAYVRYPFEDLLGILALESQRNRCLVVGEDLGTVPAGFRERMAAANVLSYRVLYFEKDGERFRRPGEYPALALACVTTHDLATLSGFWCGADIELKRQLNLYPSEDSEHGERHSRAGDRQQMLYALADEGLLPEGISPQMDENGTMSPKLSAALHRYLAQSPASILLIQMDDLLQEMDQINVPGTVDERPNWRRRFSHTVANLSAQPVAQALTPALSFRCPPAS